MEGKMLVGHLFVISLVLLKMVGAYEEIECKRGDGCFVPINTTFRLWSKGKDGAAFDCSKSLEWSSSDTPLNNGSDGFSMECSENTAWLIKKNATLSDSRDYYLTYDDGVKFVCPKIFVFSATLWTQPSEDGQHLGVLLQLQTPLKEQASNWSIGAFNCSSAKRVTPMYMKGTHWRLLGVALDDESNLCCHFNVSNGSYSSEFYITPYSVPKTSPCPEDMSTSATLVSTSPGNQPGATEPIKSATPQMKLLSTAVMTFIVNSVFQFV